MVSEVNLSFSVTPTAFRIGPTDAGVVPQYWQSTERAPARRGNRAVPHGWLICRNRLETERSRLEMNAPAGSQQPASAAPMQHVPVLRRQAIAHLAPHDGGVYIDGTFGAGGHAAAILDTADVRVIGIDRDPRTIAGGRALVEASGGRLTLVEGRFAALDHIASDLGLAAVDGIILDLGVSSMQLDEPERGFSFRHDGPLDMRMSDEGPSAAAIVAVASER